MTLTSNIVFERTKKNYIMKKPFRFTVAMDRILTEGFYNFHFLTAELITRLFYSPGTLVTVKKYLKELEDEKYLSHIVLPTATGKRPHIYILGYRGKKYLEEKGLEAKVFYKQSEAILLNYPFLTHTLEINKFLIEAMRLEKFSPLRPHIDFEAGKGMTTQNLPAVFLNIMDHDILLKRQPFYVTPLTGETFGIIPDAVFEFRVRLPNKAQKHRKLFWLEIDRGTHRNDKILHKIEQILIMHESNIFQSRYGGAWDIKYCFVSTVGNDRLEKLRILTRQAIEKMYTEEERRKKGALFLFATFPSLREESVNPDVLFLSPYWLKTYGDKSNRYPLINLQESE
jgi:hypothetical protein